MPRNNNYRLIDTRIDKGVLGVHDPTRPFCVVVTDRDTGRMMHVWRYASKRGRKAGCANAGGPHENFGETTRR